MLVKRHKFSIFKNRIIVWHAAFHGALLVLATGSKAPLDLLVFTSFDPSPT
jgi:hypothetical protein